MELTVLGGCGAWPAAGQACGGYLVEHGDHRLLLDPGYATLPQLLQFMDAADVDAVAVSHGHPDHCADLNPLLRARFLGSPRAPRLPVYAPAGALDAVLALDGPGALASAYELHELGDHQRIGPFDVHAAWLPHFVPNAGLRIEVGGAALAYTGDCGPSPLVVELARGAAVLLAEATYPDWVPPEHAAHLTSARQAGRYASEAGVDRLVLTHLWPGTDPRAAHRAAAHAYRGPIDVASGGLTVPIPVSVHRAVDKS